MFIVDDDLFSAFSGVMRKNCLRRAVKRFEAEYPERCECIGQENVERFIEQSLEKAERYNMRSEYEFNGLTLLMQYFGCGFDADPQYPWARFQKFEDSKPDDPEPPSRRALTSMYKRFAAVQKLICGENNAFLTKALERACLLDFRRMVSRNSDSEIMDTLYALYPEKFTVCLSTPEERQGLLHLALDKAMQRTMHTGFGKHLFACLIMFCGAAVDDDPLFAPLHPCLNGEFPPGCYREEYLLRELQDFCRQRIAAMPAGKSSALTMKL
jgi:hypothetical protein